MKFKLIAALTTLLTLLTVAPVKAESRSDLWDASDRDQVVLASRRYVRHHRFGNHHRFNRRFLHRHRRFHNGFHGRRRIFRRRIFRRYRDHDRIYYSPYRRYRDHNRIYYSPYRRYNRVYVSPHGGYLQFRIGF